MLHILLGPLPFSMDLKDNNRLCFYVINPDNILLHVPCKHVLIMCLGLWAYLFKKSSKVGMVSFTQHSIEFVKQSRSILLDPGLFISFPGSL